MIYNKDTVNREERQIKKRPPLRAEKRRALTGDERHLQCYCTAARVRSQGIKKPPRSAVLQGGSRFDFRPDPDNRAECRR